jgi:hypothetical protein
MSSSKFASSFAPYVSFINPHQHRTIMVSVSVQTPPPDDPLYEGEQPTRTSSARTWFPPSQIINTSYQSGAIPTFNTSASNALGPQEDAEGHQNQWETRYGLRVDMLAAAAYLLGPISGEQDKSITAYLH